MSNAIADEPRSYWHATASPPVPADALPDAADVAVVGGGMLGVWTAYWLARAGVDVVLIERTAISWGATGRNGGFVTAGLADGFAATAARVGEQDARAIWALSAEGRALVRSVVAEEGIDCDFREPGTLHLALGDAGLAERRAAAAQLAIEGVAVEELDRQGVRRFIHTPLGLDITGGLFFPGNALLHSARYLAGVAAAARRHGARLCEAEVTSVAPDGAGTRIVTSRGTLQAGRVVIGVNAWTDELVPALAGLIVPVRGQVIAYAPLPSIFTTGVGASVTPTGEYWQQTLDGSIVLGGCRANAPGGDIGVRTPVPTSEVIGALEAVFPRLFPELPGMRAARSWAGLMAFTSDYLPVVDAAPELPGVWVAGGFCGHGMPFGPRLGQLLAQAATSGVTPEELAPLRIARQSLTALVHDV